MVSKGSCGTGSKTKYRFSFAIARTSANTHTSCKVFLSLFLTESHGHREDWKASLLSVSDLESSADSSFFVSNSEVLLKSIFWANFARLSDKVSGLQKKCWELKSNKHLIMLCTYGWYISVPSYVISWIWFSIGASTDILTLYDIFKLFAVWKCV